MYNINLLKTPNCFRKNNSASFYFPYKSLNILYKTQTNIQGLYREGFTLYSKAGRIFYIFK